MKLDPYFKSSLIFTCHGMIPGKDINYKNFGFIDFVIRLTYYNLKSDTGLNLLSNDEKAKIWTPKLLFANTENNLG